MKKSILLVLLILAAAFVLGIPIAQSQTGRRGYGMGPGMMGGYGSGYGMSPGMMGGWIDVPTKLPAPKNAEWVQKLREILALEKQSLAQYQADQEIFNAYMPYMMVIPQEENHIEWIEELFKAYGLPSDVKTAPVVENKTLTAAYELSIKMESDLLPRYEWLVKKAEDRDTAQVLNTILLQSRWHLVMFDHALRMGHGYGYSRGLGMMGGYGGYGMMGGYGRQSQPAGKPIDAKEAEAMMKDYLKSSNNPNLKLGKIKDNGYAFEAEIRTRNNALVDKILIDKTTGSVRSAY
jgi:rubrerythrin